MDSTQIASNIVSASRLQLLVEALQRVERILSEADKARLAETFAPYAQDSAGHYTYRVKGKEAQQEHLQKIGQVIHVLLLDLKAAYAAESAYQVLERIFADNFHLLESGPKAKQNKELTSDCLQSVDDLEATYRTKGTGHYKGYVANLTETCDPENELQLITIVQVAPNNTDDAQLLAETLPNLKERTGLETMITDGGYNGEASDAALQAQDVNLVQTAIRGLQPNPDKFHLSDFDLHADEKVHPVTLTCPHGQTVPVTPARTPKTRPALPAGFHFSGSHHAIGETSLPGRQNAGTRAIQSDLHGNRIRRHNQRAAHPTLPVSQNKGRTGRKNHKK